MLEPIGDRLDKALKELENRQPTPKIGEPCKGCNVGQVSHFMFYTGLCRKCLDEGFAARAKAEQIKDRLSRCGIAPRHNKFTTWDGLKGSSQYMAAVKHVRTFCESGQSVLAVIGGRGSGKTQALSVGVRTAIVEGDKMAMIVHISELCGDLKRRYDGEGDAEGKWVKYWSNEIDLLVIDEIGEFVAGDSTRAAIARLIDKRYTNLQPTIIAGNLVPGQLVECMGASTADRCGEGGGIVQFIGWPSFRGVQADA